MVPWSSAYLNVGRSGGRPEGDKFEKCLNDMCGDTQILRLHPHALKVDTCPKCSPRMYLRQVTGGHINESSL